MIKKENDTKQFDYQNNLFLENTKIVPGMKNLVGIKLERFSEALRKLKTKSRVLDLACGVGTFTGCIHYYQMDVSVYGLDISQKALSIASNNYDDILFLRADAMRLPFCDSSFDMVCGFDILEHVRDTETIISEIKRVLKPGGYIHFHIPCEGEAFTLWWFLWKIKLGGDIKKIHAGHIQRFTSKNIKRIIKESGFKIVSIKYSYHAVGQLLDFIQWAATSLRKNAEARNVDVKTLKSGNNAHKIIKAGFKVYYLLIHMLEIVSYYETKLLYKIKPSMAIDITAEKKTK